MGRSPGFRQPSARDTHDAMLKRLLILLAILIAAAAGLAGYAYSEAVRTPVVRQARVGLPDWPQGAAPLKIVLISDIHIGTAAMDAGRLGRIVAQINALHPDLVVIAGDFIFGHVKDSAERLGAPMVEPLSKLRAPLGVVAVLGNHDHWTGGEAVRVLLERAGATVVENGAIRRGVLVLGVVGDDFSRHADLPATLAAMAALPGPRLMLSHSPDIAPQLPDEIRLLLAGHTHCGQVMIPFHGPVSDVSRYGPRYRCGVRTEGKRTVITTAGLGTSGGPFRLGAPPDLWLVTVGPE